MKTLLTYLFLILNTIVVFSSTNTFTNPNYRFKKIGIEQGLSQSTIMSIIQDDRGYMWFGTATGLNRYDGYEFVVYQKDMLDSLSISDNEITALFKDRNGSIWVGTSDGILNRFKPSTEDFEHFDIANSSDWYSTETQEYSDFPLSFNRFHNSTITSIVEDKDGNLWIGTWGKGIVNFDPKSGKKKYYYHFKNRQNSLSSNKIINLCIDKHENIWVGTFGGGLNRIKTNNKAKIGITIDSFQSENRRSIGNIITAILEDHQDNLWIGSYDQGLSIIPNSEIDKSFKDDGQGFNAVSVNNEITNIMAIAEDQNSVVWIGTYGNGLYSYSGEKYQNYSTEANDPFAISENEIQSLYVDNSGILWIGTQLGSGINKLEIGIEKFYTAPMLTEPNKSMNDNIVWAIHEDSNDKLWIGTHRGGINIWDKESNTFTYFSDQQSLSNKHVRAFAEDHKGNIWIGNYAGGLSVFLRQENKVYNFSRKNTGPSSFPGTQIQSLLVEGDSILWIGAFGGGLNKLNLKDYYQTGKAKFKKYIYHPTALNSISDDRVYTLLLDSKGILWVGTHGGGLNKFNRETETFTRYQFDGKNIKTISNNRILVIHEILNGNLLIGTFGGGLNLFDRKLNNFERLNEKLTLNCSDIYGILPEDEGYWLSTNNGIYKINSEINSFINFDLSDGLQSLEYSGGAYSIGKDGTYYFGGINGLNYFNPKTIQMNDFVPPIVISKVKVFDIPIKGERTNLIFGRDENYFSFEFASLDFNNSNKNKYKFILEGLDSKWSYTDAENRRVFYTNLAPGKYTFKVMGTNNDGIWSPNEARVDITILAPFWMRWWFIGMIIIVIGGLVSFYINQRIRYLIALDKLKSNIAADLHDNVGAGLTEISILSELATNEIEKPIKATKHIGQISELSRQLVESMSDIVWVVNPTRDSLYDLIVRLKDMYGELLADLGIKLKTNNLDKLSTIKLSMDYRQNLYLILKESINNSIKHSKCTIINLTVDIIKNKLIISVADNGLGFDMSNISFGNGLLNIEDRGKKIGGKINLMSKPEEGTTIEFEGKIK